MARSLVSLCGLQVIACLVGLGAGCIPGISWTGRFWGLGITQGDFGFARPSDAPVRVIQVESGSPAYRAGFRVGDEIQQPRTIDDVIDAQHRMRQGKQQTFTVRRDEQVRAIESAGFAPELAAVWYADPWYPIAGSLFLGIGIFVFATAPLQPAPFWRSIPLTVAGVGIAVGFGLTIAWENVFHVRRRVYQRWPTGTGEEWYVQQGLIGIAASILLAIFAAAEIRQRLAKPRAASEP